MQQEEGEVVKEEEKKLLYVSVTLNGTEVGHSFY